MAVFINQAEMEVNAGPHTVVYWKHGESRPTFMNLLNPLYEPLQYPLFYPHGTNGWHINLHSLSPPAYAIISQIEYYRQRVLTGSRFGMLGRLLNEYLVDMFSSVEDNRLNYVRFNLQTRIAAQREIDETIETEGGPRAGVYLPASHMCSPRMQRKLIADGLAIVRRHGKPTYFITVTCDPNWEEIRGYPSVEGQNASDRPGVTYRVFRARLQLILKTLKDGLLGHKVFVLCDPHAHE